MNFDTKTTADLIDMLRLQVALIRKACRLGHTDDAWQRANRFLRIEGEIKRRFALAIEGERQSTEIEREMAEAQRWTLETARKRQNAP